MSAPKQTGVEVKVGFQGLSLEGYLPEDGFQVVKGYSDKEEIHDTNGCCRTKIRTNPFTEWEGELVVDSDSDFQFTEGDTLTITPCTNAGTPGTPVVAEVQEGTAARLNRKSIRVNIKLRAEDSMTYTTA